MRAAKKPVAEAKPVPVAEDVTDAELVDEPKKPPKKKPQPSAEVRDFFERGPNESEDEYFDRVGSQTRRRGESEDEMFDRLERRANKLPKVRRAPKQKSLFTPDFTLWLEATRK